MELNTIIQKLMECGEDTCPCEKGIPCPKFHETEYSYCEEGNCCPAMVELIYKIVLKK